MSDRPKPKQKNDWRTKEVNHSLHKYTSLEILNLYFPSTHCNFIAPEAIFSKNSIPPLLLKQKTGVACTNSRNKSGTKEEIPEWYTEDASLGKKGINLEEIEEKYSKIDIKYEDSIKKVIEEDEKIPDWDDPDEEESTSISYPSALIEEHANEGNPFACIINNHSMHFDGQIIPEVNSIPFEKVWFYKDPQNTIQGPFSTIDMFNWSAAGFFSSKLQIAHSTPTHFFSLQMYILQEKSKQIPSYAKVLK